LLAAVVLLTLCGSTAQAQPRQQDLNRECANRYLRSGERSFARFQACVRIAQACDRLDRRIDRPGDVFRRLSRNERDFWFRFCDRDRDGRPFFRDNNEGAPFVAARDRDRDNDNRPPGNRPPGNDNGRPGNGNNDNNGRDNRDRWERGDRRGWCNDNDRRRGDQPQWRDRNRWCRDDDWSRDRGSWCRDRNDWDRAEFRDHDRWCRDNWDRDGGNRNPDNPTIQPNQPTTPTEPPADTTPTDTTPVTPPEGGNPPWNPAPGG
jgi:hypothetical protein